MEDELKGENKMFEALPAFLIYMSVLFVPLVFLAMIWYAGVLVLFCVYKHNGGKYNLKKFIKTRGLEI